MSLRLTRFLTLLISLIVLASACSSSNSPVGAPSDDDTGTDDTDDQVVDLDDADISLVAALKPFAECSALLDHLKAEASERVGPWGLSGGGYFGPEVEEAMEDEAMEDSAGGDGSTAQPVSESSSDSAEGGSDGDFSGTNVQELGVDEPDMVKTDGKRIYVLKDSRLIVFDVSGDAPERVHDIELSNTDDAGNGDEGEGQNAWFHQMFITTADAGTKVYVIGEGNGALPAADDATNSGPEGRFYVQSTVIREVDLSDAEANPGIRSLHIEGNSVSARLVGSDLRFVVSTFPNDLGFVSPGANNEKAEEKAIAVNKEVIAESTLEDWLPAYSLVANGEVTTGLLSQCDQVHQPNEFAGFGALSVVSIDTSTPLAASTSSSVLSEGRTVYASTEALFVTTNSWIDPRSWEDPEFRPEDDWSTSIHKFSTPMGAAAEYQASGSVDGSLLNQFSMSEYDGVFRVATTEGSPWGRSEETSVSSITTFEQQGDQLVQLGHVGGMGEGEQIFSVRYVGDLAYVVTFRQTDPLYTVDLADPANPTILGELKITGYSGYLHPISDTLVVGIGQEASEEGRTEGAKVTLFDVSDLAAPTALDSWVLPNSYTEAEWDHRSALWWADENLLVIPVQQWGSGNGDEGSSGEGFFGAVALTIADGTITEKGRLSHIDTEAQGQTDCRRLTTADLPEGSERESELWYILNEEGENSVILACTADQRGGYSGYSCEKIPADEIRNWFGPVEGLDLGDADRIEMCWLDSYQDSITRALVIGDKLWTISRSTIQANAIDTLEKLTSATL